MTRPVELPKPGSSLGVARIPVRQYDEIPIVPDSDFFQEYANVLGVNVSAIDLDRAVEMADRWISAENRGYICVTGVHGVMEARADSAVRRALNRALMNVPDGMPMSWVGHLQGFRDMDRVFGPGLFRVRHFHEAVVALRSRMAKAPSA